MIEEAIANGKLMPHEKLPSERELCEKYSLSRTTVRQSISEAVNEGLLYRIHGKGTFVAKPKIDQELEKITGFKETLLLRGLNPSIKVLEMQRTAADLTLASVLKKEVGDEVLYLRLLGLADEEPMILYSIYLPAMLDKREVEQLISTADKGELFSMFIKYHQKVGLTPGSAHQSFEAVVADEETSSLLKISQGDPLLRLTSIGYSREKQPIEYRTAHYRGDKYRFSMKRKYYSY